MRAILLVPVLFVGLIVGFLATASLVEFVELPADVHPYYVSTQAHPELRSRPTRPHPLFAGLVGAAIERQRSERFPIDESGLRRKDEDDED